MLVSINANAQDSYTIELNINGKADSVLYLTRYYGDKFQWVDTARNDSGKFIFSGEKALSGGIYLLVNPAKSRLIEFPVNNEQHFRIGADSNFNLNTIVTVGNRENDLFLKHLLVTNRIYGTLSDLQKNQSLHQDDKELKSETEQKIKTLRDSIHDFREKEIANQPGTFYAVLLKAMIEPVLINETNLSASEAFYQRKKHFWDNFDLSDPRLLRTPMLAARLKVFTEQMTMQVPDSLIVAIDKLIQSTGTNTETRDYILWHYASKYQYPEIMGLDAVFVHLADTYFGTLDIAGTSKSVKAKVQEKANQLRNLLLGSSAPDLWLTDTTGSFRSFKELKSTYIVLYFWDFECGICKKEMEHLKILQEKHKDQLQVYAVNVNADLAGWKDYLLQHPTPWIHVNGTHSLTRDFHDLYDIYSTPVVYVLNQQFNIIAKRIKAEQVEQIIGSIE